MSELPIEYQRRPIAVDEYYRMADAGVFDPDERLELLEGEIVVVPPIGSPHAGAVTAIAGLLTHRLWGKAIVRRQVPLAAGPFSEPELDISVVALEPSGWRTRHPAGADAFLVIEVAHSSRSVDLRKKPPIYARAGVPELWVVDIPERRIVVLREPRDSSYAIVRLVRLGESLTPLAFPALAITALEMLGADTPQTL